MDGATQLLLEGYGILQRSDNLASPEAAQVCTRLGPMAAMLGQGDDIYDITRVLAE